MYARFKVVGLVLIVAGLLFAGVGGYTYLKTQAGATALQTFSAAQNVTLTYNEQGQLVDRGETAGAEAIMGLLTNDWGYAVDQAELNPNDPVVNTASEYMYQMATIAYHTLNGTQTVVLTEPAEFDGQTFAAGSYEVPVAGRYWTEFNRQNPIDAKVREQAWTGTAHALIAELGVGSVTASALQVGYGIAAIAAALGATLMLLGVMVIWATRPAEAEARATVPATSRKSAPATA